MVYIKTYVFNHLYQQYLVLLTMVSRNNRSENAASEENKSATPTAG